MNIAPGRGSRIVLAAIPFQNQTDNIVQLNSPENAGALLLPAGLADDTDFEEDPADAELEEADDGPPGGVSMRPVAS